MAILFLIIFMDLVGFGLLIPLLPFYVQRVGAGPEIITLVLGLYSLGQFVAAPLWGRLSDSWGRKPVLALTSFGLAASYLMLAYADSLALLVVSRLFGGIMAGNIAAAQAYVSDVTTSATRAKNMGILGAALGLGFTFGPAIGGVLGGHDLATADFKTPALAAAAVTAAAAIAVVLFLKESLDPAIHAGRSQQSRALLHQRLRAALSRHVLVTLIAAGFLCITAFALFEAVFGLWANAVFRYGPAQIGYVLTGMGVISVAVQGGAIGRLSRAFGERNLVTAGLALSGLGYAAIALAASQPIMIGGCVLLTLGSALFNPGVASLVSREAADHERGAVLGLYQGASALGRVIGPAFAGLLYVSWGTQAPFWAAVALVAPALALAVLVRRRGR